MSTPTTISQPAGIRKIIAASSLGTLIEWYDFCIYGSLATVLASQFYPHSHPTAALLSTLATFAVGFIARPFGALVFGRFGDLVGRKHAFVLTMIIMGGSTFAIGLVPGYAQIGFAAPLLVVLLRLVQGLALGGEFGGAATFVAEHAPVGRRGLYTSWIQATATVGLLLSLGVTLLVQHGLDTDQARSLEKFNAWGWRIPFLLSIVLVAFSVYVRRKLQESPVFERLKTEGRLAASPLAESFGRKTNLKLVLLALFGATMGQGVVLYAGQFYTQVFLQDTCLLDFDQTKTMLLLAILLATPFFILFGAWSDKIGRKWIMLGGMILAIMTYPFLFRGLLVIPGTQGRTEFTTQKEIVSTVAFIGKTKDILHTSNTISHYDGGLTVTQCSTDTIYASGKAPVTRPVITVSHNVSGTDYWKMVGILFLLIFYIAMVYGPIAAFLAELFPAHIRYTSISLPYHVGNGIFGALTPFFATLLVARHPGAPLAGLWYPIGIAVVCVLVGAIFLPRKTKNA